MWTPEPCTSCLRPKAGPFPAPTRSATTWRRPSSCSRRKRCWGPSAIPGPTARRGSSPITPLAWGWDPKTGQLFNEGSALGPAHDRSLQWWAQYEWLNALSLLHTLEGKTTSKYWEAFTKAWTYTRATFLDPEFGGIYQGLDARGQLNREKSQNWFAGYHTGRALLLIADRMRALADEAEAK
jgi:hypothetical protein